MTYESILTAAAQLSIAEKMRLIKALGGTVPDMPSEIMQVERLPDVILEPEPFAAFDLPRPGTVRILTDAPILVQRLPDRLEDILTE